jgi:hypothetical protein
MVRARRAGLAKTFADRTFDVLLTDEHGPTICTTSLN